MVRNPKNQKMVGVAAMLGVVVQQLFMHEKLGTLYPNIQFMGEEKDNSDIDMNGLIWVLDPVDGTCGMRTY